MTTVNHTVMVVKSRPKQAMHRQREQIKQEIAYGAALELVERITKTLGGLENGNSATAGGHYRTKSGRVLFTLDQVVRAILAGDIQVKMDGAI